ncbi:hypothetical protein C8A00DRAFT_19618 [Chaetomidium leptoderma]|uniref:FAD-binding FR-type domain-containing protein n=1 Tax=Chaetomidium leptoderma TaxID=669021 RepID=A0AAN6ZSM2_9PEZI|nr:hypothetical protein C8A00DRAFT_19618 [Chaetomidium leptoderma]
MDIHEYFAVALWSLLILWGLLYFLHRYLPLLRFAFAYLAQVQISLINYTLPEIGATILYLSANAAALRIEGLSSSHLFAIVNLVLLYLGGRTSLVANSIGISLRTYYLAHHWVAVAVVALSLVHVTQAIKSRSFDKLQAISGGIVAGLLCVCLVLSSVHSVAHSIHYTLFQSHHVPLALCILIASGWHLWTVSVPFSFAWLMVFGTGSLWIVSVALRLLRWYGYRGARVVIQSSKEAMITRLSVDTGSTIPALPGSYFYVNIPGQRSGVCVPVIWWSDEENESVRHFEILINRRIESIASDFRPRLGGPYGGDLSMGSFETLVLAGEGIGIAGVLPFALSLVSRKKRDKRNNGDAPLYCDITRSIDLVWKLDSNRQYDCAAEYFESLADALRDITGQTSSKIIEPVAAGSQIIGPVAASSQNDKRQVSFLRVFII